MKSSDRLRRASNAGASSTFIFTHGRVLGLKCFSWLWQSWLHSRSKRRSPPETKTSLFCGNTLTPRADFRRSFADLVVQKVGANFQNLRSDADCCRSRTLFALPFFELKLIADLRFGADRLGNSCTLN